MRAFVTAAGDDTQVRDALANEIMRQCLNEMGYGEGLEILDLASPDKIHPAAVNQARARASA
jgi:hypothetical protein